MWKKASFTVEAAYLVPLMLIFITYLLGFTYFTHQKNWCKGAAYESLYYAMQRNTGESGENIKAGEIAGNRLTDRIAELPLEVSEISSEVTESTGKLSAEMNTDILPEVFGDRFTMNQSVSAVKVDAAALKQAAWLVKYTIAGL